MESKRALYKKANSEGGSTIQNEKRKTLQQGRLVMKPVAQMSYDSNVPSASVNSAVDEASPSHRGLVSDGRTSAIVSSQQIENNTTPRKRLPHVSLEESPKEAKPSHSLDLSDTDTECDGTAAGGAEVMVVNASGPKSLNDTEVDIALEFAQSPAKVICHSPGRVPSAVLRTMVTGDVSTAAKVDIEQVPSVCVTGIDGGGDNSDAGLGHQSPLVVRETDLPAAALPHFKALMALSDHSGQQHESEMASSDSSHSEAGDHSRAHRTDHVVVNYGPAKAKCVTLASEEYMSQKLATRRKAPRVVASRYMQASAAKGPMKADRSVVPESFSIAQNTTVCDNKKLQSKQKTGGSRGASIRRSNSYSNTLKPFSVTPSCRSSFGGHASTPTVPDASEDSLFLSETGPDISAIGPAPALSDEATSLHKPQTGSQLRDSGYVYSDSLLKVIKPGASGEITQWDLELLYGRLIQWAFLESKARKCLHDQDKQATAQINALSALLEKERRREAELELELARLKHANVVDEMLELQSSGVGPAVSKLTPVESQYHQLASALDSTRHHMPTKGIYLPADGKEEYLAELAKALQETEHLLGEISVMTRKQAPAVEQCAKVLSSMEGTVEHEVASLSRCQSLLSSVCSKLDKENALRLQLLFANDTQTGS